MKEVLLFDKIIITPLLKAQASLEEVLAEPKTVFVRDAAIQRFEFTFELAWKTQKRVLAHLGISANSPRSVFREAAKEGLIKDPNLWFEFLEDRNRTVHTYNQDTAESIYSGLPRFKAELDIFLESLLKK